MIMGTEITSALRTVKAFGLRDGVRAYIPRLTALLSAVERDHQSRIVVPGLPKPLWLRSGRSDWQVLEDIFVSRDYDTSYWPDYDAELDRTYAHALNRGFTPVIIDCGANIGLASIWFTQRYPRAMIFSIEPEEGNFALLLKNTCPFANIRPIRAAISDHATRVELIDAGGEPWGWQTRESANAGIEALTVETLLSRIPRSIPLIVKIDIEGAEVDLFRSSTEWVSRTPLIVFELHDWLGGWRGTGHAVFTSLTTHRREYVQRRHNTFSFARVSLQADGSQAL